GASRIIAVDALASKESLAMQFGATDWIDATKGGSVSRAIRDRLPLCKGIYRPGGVDWAFECSGVPKVLHDALASLDWGGTAVAVGVPPQTAMLEPPIFESFIYIDR